MSATRDGTDARLNWAPSDVYGGSGTRYDVITGLPHELPVGSGASANDLYEDLDALEALHRRHLRRHG